MTKAEQAKRQSAFDPVGDKRLRYRVEYDPWQSIVARGQFVRLVVVLTKRDAVDETLQIVFYNLKQPNPDWRYEGPVWKQGHAKLYAEAALAEWREGGEKLPAIGDVYAELPEAATAEPLALPTSVTAPPPLARAFPPSAPCCPSCGARMTYQCDYVGGRGSCWRHRCPGVEAGTCTYIEAWKS